MHKHCPYCIRTTVYQYLLIHICIYLCMYVSELTIINPVLQPHSSLNRHGRDWCDAILADPIPSAWVLWAMFRSAAISKDPLWLIRSSPISLGPSLSAHHRFYKTTERMTLASRLWLGVSDDDAVCPSDAVRSAPSRSVQLSSCCSPLLLLRHPTRAVWRLPYPLWSKLLR